MSRLGTVAGLPRQGFTGIGGLAFHPSMPLFAAMDTTSRQIDCYRIDYPLLGEITAGPGSRRYGNAKVVLARGHRGGEIRARAGAQRAAVPADGLDSRPQGLDV